jgi:hypothetical protein
MDNHPLPPNKRRETLLRLSLGELAAWHLAASCAVCRAERIVSVRSLIERYGGEPELRRVVARLRCGAAQCGQKPSLLRLRNRLPVHPGPPLIDVLLIDARPVRR